MTNDLKTFTNDQFGSLRTITINNEPWFVAADVCRALEIGNPSQALSRLEDDEKYTTLISNEGAASGKSQMAFISEPGLYSLVLGSRKPEARQFKRWITHDVIPAIRSHGGYLTPELTEQVLSDPDTIIRLATDLKRERSARVAAEQRIALDAPKVLFADAVSSSQDDIPISELAKFLKQNGVDTGRNRLFDTLRADGYIQKFSTEPTQKAMELGLFRIVERTHLDPDGSSRLCRTTKVTGKGQTYFIQRYIKSTQYTMFDQ